MTIETLYRVVCDGPGCGALGNAFPSEKAAYGDRRRFNWAFREVDGIRKTFCPACATPASPQP